VHILANGTSKEVKRAPKEEESHFWFPQESLRTQPPREKKGGEKESTGALEVSRRAEKKNPTGRSHRSVPKRTAKMAIKEVFQVRETTGILLGGRTGATCRSSETNLPRGSGAKSRERIEKKLNSEPAEEGDGQFGGVVGSKKNPNIRG